MAALRSLDPAVKVRVLLPERTRVNSSDPERLGLSGNSCSGVGSRSWHSNEI